MQQVAGGMGPDRVLHMIRSSSRGLLGSGGHAAFAEICRWPPCRSHLSTAALHRAELGVHTLPVLHQFCGGISASEFYLRGLSHLLKGQMDVWASCGGLPRTALVACPSCSLESFTMQSVGIFPERLVGPGLLQTLPSKGDVLTLRRGLVLECENSPLFNKDKRQSDGELERDIFHHRFIHKSQVPGAAPRSLPWVQGPRDLANLSWLARCISRELYYK